MEERMGEIKGEVFERRENIFGGTAVLLLLKLSIHQSNIPRER